MDNNSKQPTRLNIAAEFPPHTMEQWKQAVEETLKGVPFDKAMITKTYEGIDLKPIYTLSDIQNLAHLNSLPGQPPFVRGNKAEGYTIDGWKIAQEQNECDPAVANKVILDELNRGLNAVNIKLSSNTLSGKIPNEQNLAADGVCITSLEDFCTLLKDVALQAVPIFLKSSSIALPILGLLNAYLKKIDIMLAEVEGCVGFAPLTILLKDGKLGMDLETAYRQMYQMTYWADVKAQKMRTILLDAAVYGDSGCNAVQELAFAMSTANEYIKAMLERGLSIEQIAQHCQLNISLGSNFFMEIAKVRSARLLWAELMQAYGAREDSRKIWIHGVTTAFNKTVYDPYVNVLRTATEGFSGVIGGLDSLEITPFDEFVRPDAEFSRRIARNQQIILGEESHFAKVIDPAGGCYYIETLTAQMAEKAWSKMQEIEAQGGMLKSILSGALQSEVQKIASERMSNADKRKDVFVGINMFANNLETPLEQPEELCSCGKLHILDKISEIVKADRTGLHTSLQYMKDNPVNDFMVDMVTDAWLHKATIEEICSALYPAEHIIKAEIIPRYRAVQHLEELRDRVIDFQQKHETVLSVFLANMGPITQHKARADFAMGFLQVGGFYVANNDGFETVEAAADGALFSKAQAVCICSTDDTYPELVPQIVAQIKAKKADMIFMLAGFPQDMVENFKSLGIDIFVHIRANAFDTLTELANRMGVK